MVTPEGRDGHGYLGGFKEVEEWGGLDLYGSSEWLSFCAQNKVTELLPCAQPVTSGSFARLQL